MHAGITYVTLILKKKVSEKFEIYGAVPVQYIQAFKRGSLFKNNCCDVCGGMLRSKTIILTWSRPRTDEWSSINQGILHP